MATKPQSVIADLRQGYVRGETSIGVSEAEALRARMVFAYAQTYYPKEVALFVASLGDIPQSFEDERYLRSLIQFTKELLGRRSDDEMLQSVSPKEMVEEISEQLIEDAKLRRATIRRRANDLIKKYVRGTPSEQGAIEDKLVEAIRASVDASQTPQQLRASIEHEVAMLPLPPKEVAHDLLDENHLSAQRLLFTGLTHEAQIFEQIPTLPAPAWRAYVAAVESLPMRLNETVDEHVSSAKDVGLVEAFLSSDLSQAPAARAGPGALVTAILEASDNKEALKVFEKLSEQAKNAASFLVIANAWEKTVDVITRRAGGALAQGLEPIIREANKQPVVGSIKQAAVLVGDVVNPLLGRTFERLMDVDALRLLSPDKTKALVSSPPTLLLLAVYTWRPGDLQFEWQQAQDGGGLGAWAVHIAKDSVLEKLFYKFVKSKAVEAAGGVVKKGGASLIAGLLTKLGLSAAADVVITMIGTPVATAIKWAIQAAIWLGGYIWRPVSNFLGKLTRGEIAQLGAAQNAIKQTLDSWLGPRPPSKPKQWYEQDWVVAALVVAAAVFLPMLGVVHLFTARDSALFVASFPSNTGGPYIESFPPYYGPFPEESPPLASCPVSSAPITQKPFGGFSHEGVCAYDFGSQKGALVYATHDGCVAALRSDVPNDTFIEGEFGNYVRLAGTSPAGHYYTIYAHLVQGSGLSAGTCVKAGDVIGRVDTTGFTFDSTGRRGGGTHLHYQYNDDQKTCPSLPAGCGY